jgi:NitT/TauT family transport system ATP-binding protein
MEPASDRRQRGSNRLASSAAAPVLELQGVGKRFSDRTLALDGIDLEVGQGELVSVVGPSGCGKSTLLRIAAGLTEPTSGIVSVRTRRIGLPRALSGGTRMRASLARSLVPRPELLLVDEPFGALDELTRHRLNDELAQLFLEQRFAALLIAHSVTEAVFLSRRVVVLSPGPGRVVGTFQVPFAYPRPPRLRSSSGFSRLVAEVSECLHDGAAPRGPGATGASSGAARRPEAVLEHVAAPNR